MSGSSLHTDLTILARLVVVLARARAVPIAPHRFVQQSAPDRLQRGREHDTFVPDAYRADGFLKLDRDMQRLVRQQGLGFVATVCPDGTPNLSPKGTTTAWDDQHLVFLHLHSPGTIANLATNPSLEINVVDPIVRKGYRFKGEARVVTGGELFEQILDFYRRERDTDRTRVRAAVIMRVHAAAPIISPVYDSGATEVEVADRWREHYLSLHHAPTSHSPADA